MSHTKGPWVARQDYANRWRIEVSREGFVPQSVAIVTTTVLEMGGPDENTEANVLLIAAAPDLLEACEAEEWYATHYEKCGACQDGCACSEGMELASRAQRLRISAIAKAKGADGR